MSGKRLNKRQLREQQELQELEDTAAPTTSTSKAEPGAAEEAETSDSEEDAGPVASSGGGVFAQLAQAGDDGGTSEEENEDINTAAPAKSKSKNRRRRNKKKGGAAATIEGDKQQAGDATMSGNDENQGEGLTDEQKDETEASAPSTAASKKKKKKPAGKGAGAAQDKKNAQKSQNVADMSMDEFSALLASQAKVKEGDAGAKDDNAQAAAALTGPLIELRGQLAMSAQNLDPAIELRRQFGAAAIKAYEAEAGANAGGSAASGARARAMARNPNLKIRSILVQPKETWPPITMTFTGMNMEIMDDSRGRGKLGAWTHSRAYREVQAYFLQAVASYDPNQLVGILQRYPWHIDTLLQLSDVSRHQGDLGQASDFNARALFAMERTALPSFTSALTSHSGPPMLDFARIENRGFWLASHRNVNFLARRGTWRTALEWSKLIIGLDPALDHHGMLLWLDFLSVKSRQHSWFLKTIKEMERVVAEYMEQNGELITNAKTPFDEADKTRVDEIGESRGALEWLPGLAYNKALALRAVEEEQGDKKHGAEAASTAALRLAIARHPQVLLPLLDKIGVALPSEVSRAHPLFALDASTDQAGRLTDLLTHLYIARNDSLWREPDISSWLTATLQASWPEISGAFDRGDLARARLTSPAHINGIARHVLVSDLPDALRQRLIGLLPKPITSNSAMLDASDPVPPSGPGSTRYDDAYFGADGRRRRGAESGMVGALPPGLAGLMGADGQDWDEAELEQLIAQAQQAQGDEGEEGEGMNLNEARGWLQRFTQMFGGNRQAGGDAADDDESDESDDEGRAN